MKLQPIAGVLLPLLAAACGDATQTTFQTGGAPTAAQPGVTYRASFDPSATPAFPGDFAIVLGDWQVSDDPSAPSPPSVLRQTGSFPDPDFPRVILKHTTFSDVDASVRCRAESGSIDQACGIMIRVRDSENYYIARANALEGNVRLYRVVVGDRQQLGSADGVVTTGAWHTLRLSARGSTLSVGWEGQTLIELQDDAFTSGRVGLWTKADSVTAFDDFEAVAP